MTSSYCSFRAALVDVLKMMQMEQKQKRLKVKVPYPMLGIGGMLISLS